MSERISRLNGALTGRYEIERELGEGGMATVYLADDLRHERKVAIKVLKPELAAVIGAERFLVEIKTTANLQHPHILPLFDSGEADGFLYYVMPYIDGETVRDKLNRETQFGIEEAVRITTEVADALDYAHRHDVIHRDIKPENILLHDGRPVVADFGIALALSAAAGGRMTETGMSLGTPHYMSPEQATADKDLTNRSDVYSLASVLYEMLTGDPPHTGSSAQQIVMKILTEEAQPVGELRKSVPPNVAAATAKALEKLAADRFPTAKEFGEALNNPAFSLTTTGAHGGMPAAGNWRARLAVPFAVLATVFALAFVWALRRPPASLPGERFAVELPNGRKGSSGYSIALSPDGSMMAYAGTGGGPLGQLWLRRRNELHATPIPGSDAGIGPAFSKDGRELAWLRATTPVGGALMVAPLQGGTPRLVADSVVVFGLDWDENGALYFSRGEGLVRVLPGGVEEALTVVDPQAGERLHTYVDVLPGAKGALFTVMSAREMHIATVRFETGAITELVPGTSAKYLPTGHLVWATGNGTLMAAPFDPHEMVLTGSAVPVLDDVRLTEAGGATYSLVDAGTLLYETGGGTGLVEPVWVDRSGAAEEIDPGWRLDSPYLGTGGIAPSPDGTRLGVSIDGPTIDLWIKQLDTGPLTRLTFEGNRNARPFWLPDGRSLGFISNRGGKRGVWRKRADGSGAAELLFDLERPLQEGLVTPDGDWLVYRAGSGLGNLDIFATRLDTAGVESELATTRFGERAAAVSPDGRWFAYVSDESGRDEVYVRPFPNAADGRWQVSTEGGREPRWAHSGQELFYRGSGQLMAVAVTAEPTFSVGRPHALFPETGYRGDFNHVMYDVGPDDQRFVMLRAAPEEAGQLIWVQNFFEELKAKLDPLARSP